VLLFLQKKEGYFMTGKYKGTKDIPALYKALYESERLLEKEDEIQNKIGLTIKKVVLKILKQREEEIEKAKLDAVNAKKKKYGPYTHAEATAKDD